MYVYMYMDMDIFHDSSDLKLSFKDLSLLNLFTLTARTELLTFTSAD